MSIVVNPAEKPFLRDDTILIDSLSVCAHVPCNQASYYLSLEWRGAPYICEVEVR
jgi:hypothetical protein